MGQFFFFRLLTMYKAKILFHQFSAHRTFKKLDRFLYGGACIFLAAKDDDFILKLNTFIERYLYALDKFE